MSVAAPAAAAASAASPWASVAGMFAMGLGGSINGTPGMATGQQDSMFDSSGWNVNFGSGRIDSEMQKSLDKALPGQLDAYLPYAVLFVGAMIVWRMTKKS